jgi:hypothetical protein
MQSGAIKWMKIRSAMMIHQKKVAFGTRNGNDAHMCLHVFGNGLLQKPTTRARRDLFQQIEIIGPLPLLSRIFKGIVIAHKSYKADPNNGWFLDRKHSHVAMYYIMRPKQ